MAASVPRLTATPSRTCKVGGGADGAVGVQRQVRLQTRAGVEQDVVVRQAWGMIGHGLPSFDGVVPRTIQQGLGKPFFLSG
jgi:hypothetical protein